MPRVASKLPLNGHGLTQFFKKRFRLASFTSLTYSVLYHRIKIKNNGSTSLTHNESNSLEFGLER